MTLIQPKTQKFKAYCYHLENQMTKDSLNEPNELGIGNKIKANMRKGNGTSCLQDECGQTDQKLHF